MAVVGYILVHLLSFALVTSVYMLSLYLIKLH